MSHKRWGHNLFVYEDDEAFVGRMAPFLQEGIEAGEAVVAVTARDNGPLLRDALGPAAENVTFRASEEQYTRPEDAVANYDRLARALLRDGAPAIRLFGELDDRYTDGEWDGWVAYEAILNRAFSRYPISIMCGYDARVLPELAVEGVRRAHPELYGIEAGEAVENPRYEDPADVVRSLLRDSEPLPELGELSVEGHPQALRRQLIGELRAAEVPATEARDMVVAVGEVLVNARRHGGGVRAVRVGRVDGRFVCEVSDSGVGLDDPLAGHLPPAPGAPAGGGLWVARQLTSRLELLPSPDGGLTARLWA